LVVGHLSHACFAKKSYVTVVADSILT
jgi:hypothetical protein